MIATALGALSFAANVAGLFNVFPKLSVTAAAGQAGRGGYAELFTVRNDGLLPAKKLDLSLYPCRIAAEDSVDRRGQNGEISAPCPIYSTMELGVPSWSAKALGPGEVMQTSLSDILDAQPLPSGAVSSDQANHPLSEADFYVVARYRAWLFPGLRSQAFRFIAFRKGGAELEWRMLPNDPELKIPPATLIAGGALIEQCPHGTAKPDQLRTAAPGQLPSACAP